MERLLRLPWSFRQQIVVLTAAVTAVAMLLLTLVLQVVLAHITNSDIDRVLQGRTEATVTSIRASSTGGTITVPDATLDSGVAVYDASGQLIAGSPPRSVHEFYEDLVESQIVMVKEVSGSSKVRAQPFRTSDGVRGIVMVTERLEPYEEAENLALIVSLVTGALATAAAAAIAAWTMRRALRPVAELASTASDWSEHDLGRRFALGPPRNEISALAHTLDTLLDKVSSAIRSEQRLTSELAHELRTPLTSIQGSADLLALRDGSSLSPDARADLVEISAATRRMAGTISTLLDLARSDASVAAAATSDLLDVVAEVVEHAVVGNLRIRVDVGDAHVAIPHSLAVRTISPVVDNALHFAREGVSVSSSVVEGTVQVLVTDDGPGVDPALVDDIFLPGRTSGTSLGAGLGLAISRRIARTAGGDVLVAPTVDAHPAPGGCFVIRLPLA